MSVDTIARQVALEAKEHTVAVFGNRLGSIYLETNATLAERILDAGAHALASNRSERLGFLERQLGETALKAVCQPGSYWCRQMSRAPQCTQRGSLFCSCVSSLHSCQLTSMQRNRRVRDVWP